MSSRDLSLVLACQKSSFLLPEDVHYLNCAYMSPLPKRVEEAGIEGMRRKRFPATITSESFFSESNRVRQLFAQLIGASDALHVAIIPAVSYGMAIVARNTPIERGQSIVVAAEQFPSNMYAWHRLAGETGAELEVVSPPEKSSLRGKIWNEHILEAIDARTALVALSHVHWSDGTLFDLEAIGQQTREVGAAFVIDGTQSVGALPFDVKRVQPDALICAGYKWLLGPYSIGVAYFGERYLDGVPLEENWIGRRGSESFNQLVRYRDAYQPGAVRFDVGERSNHILLPMLAAALRQILAWDVSAIQEYCRALMVEFIEAARALGFAIEEDLWRGSHLFGLYPPTGTDMKALQAELRRRRVFVSVRGNALRVSPHVYNDEADVAALLEAL